jgi:NAD-dependent DNA ligase
MTSILEELPGIGPGKRRALLKTLGSLRGVRNASLEELAGVRGISARDAESIHRFFSALTAPDFSPEEAREEVPEEVLPGEDSPGSSGPGEAFEGAREVSDASDSTTSSRTGGD